MRTNAFMVSIAFVLWASAASATTCTEAIANCRAAGANKPNIDSKCQAAGAACMKSGVFVGPVSGTTWKNLRKE